MVSENTIRSIIGPVDRGIESLLKECQNPEILLRAQKMKSGLEQIKKLKLY